MGGEQSFRIGEVTFDPAALTVSGPHGVARLEPKVMAVAVYLADRAGDVVPRQAMIRDIWGNYPSADQSLSNAVSCLRKVLQDSARESRYIETVPTRGYRLIDASARPVRQYGVTVLPFRDLGTESGDDYLCEGLAEELINVLARAPGLRLTARSTAFAVARQELSLSDIGRRLDVNYAFEGSVQRVERRLRVSLHLVETHTETQIWAREFRAEWHDLFELQDVIARAALVELTRLLDLPPASLTHTPRNPRAIDPEAYACFLKGRFCWYRDNLDPGKALDYFRRAAEIEADFAPPYAGLVDCYCTYAYWQLLPQRDARARALDYAVRALSLDPDGPDVHFSDGYAQFYMAWDTRGAEAAFRRALDRNPDHVLALSFLADVCVVQGRDAEAWSLVHRLLQLDPVSAWCHFIGAGLAYWIHLENETGAVLHELGRREREDGARSMAVALVCAASGREDDALTALRNAYAERSTPLFNIARDPVFDPIRHRSEFQELLRDAGFPILHHH